MQSNKPFYISKFVTYTWLLNFNSFPIKISKYFTFLRDRLTQISSSNIWKLWIFGDNDLNYYIILRYSCQYSYFWSFQIIFQLFFIKLQNIPLPYILFFLFLLYIYNFSKYFKLPTFIEFNTKLKFIHFFFQWAVTLSLMDCCF